MFEELGLQEGGNDAQALTHIRMSLAAAKLQRRAVAESAASTASTAASTASSATGARPTPATFSAPAVDAAVATTTAGITRRICGGGSASGDHFVAVVGNKRGGGE